MSKSQIWQTLAAPNQVRASRWLFVTNNLENNRRNEEHKTWLGEQTKETQITTSHNGNRMQCFAAIFHTIKDDCDEHNGPLKSAS